MTPPRRYDHERFPCGHERNAENSRSGKNDCRLCHAAAQRRRYAADPARHRRAASEYQKRNRAAATERGRQWRANNREHHLAYMRERMRLRLVKRKDPETQEYMGIIGLDPCTYCGGPAECIDHIEALARGGADHWTNFTPACGRCNQTKHAKPLLVFLLDRGPAR